MINRSELCNELIEFFCLCQYNIDRPCLAVDELRGAKTRAMAARQQYQTDALFHAKVQALASGVMHVISRHLDEEGV